MAQNENPSAVKWNNTCSNKYFWLLEVDSYIAFNLYLNVFYCFVLDQVDFQFHMA